MFRGRKVQTLEGYCILSQGEGIVDLCSQFVCFKRQFEGLGYVVIGERGQLRLAGETAGPWEVVDPLVREEASPKGGGQGLEWVVMGPHHVPIIWTSLYIVPNTNECCDDVIQGTLLTKVMIIHCQLFNNLFR